MDRTGKGQIRFHPIQFITLTCILILGLSACSSVQPTAAAMNTTATTPTTMPSPFPTSSAPTTLTPLPEPTATPRLSSVGPWWIAYAPDHIWIMNPDGTSLSALAFPAEARGYPNNLTVAPDVRHLAFLAGFQFAEGISLYIVDLPEGTFQKIDVLQPFANFSFDEYYPGNPSYDMSQAQIAIYHDHSLAWSPDSSQLAFLGWLGGSSVDLYLYDLASEEITQLTNGPSQAYQVLWSPDGRYLLHAGVHSFGTGAGYSMAGLWVVDVARDLISDVDMGMLRGDFIFHGWLDDETFLAASFNAVCGEFNLRAVNLRTGRVEAIWPSSYGAFDIDPITWTMLLDAPEYALGDPLCNGQDIAGLVLVDEDGNARQITLTGESNGREPIARIRWSGALDAFIFEHRERISLLSRDGILREELPACPCLLPNGVDWAFMTEEAPGFWVGPAGTMPEIGVFDCDDPLWAWNPDSSMVIYELNNQLFTAQSPEFVPARAAENLTTLPNSLQWAEGE